tara:strand:- start:70 stop:543 length:474 start_codon:yes stop_codon:yes gene_type:complete
MQYDKKIFISMILKNIYKNKKNIYLIIIFLFIMHLNDSFHNLYIISKFNITERLTKSYGYCKNASYGFINDIYEKNLIDENIEILNDNPNFAFNNSIWFKFKPNNKKNKKKIILLNNKNSVDFINENKVKLIFKEKEYGIYKVLKKENNCFYLEKND